VLAWGRLYVAAEAVPVLAVEARRRRTSPSTLMADIVGAWARTRGEGVPAGKLEPCAFQGREQPLYARRLCRTHYVQRQRGKRLSPVKLPKGSGVAFGRLLMPRQLMERVRAAAEQDGVSVAEVIRRALERSVE
jgi:hypothetical protein